MINLLLSFLLLINSNPANVEAFEGSIELILESCYEKSYFTYYVKDDKVRIDKFDNDHILTQSLLISLKSKEVFALSPSKKLYTKLGQQKAIETNSENFIIAKTENFRMVGDYKCYQWRVKNKERNTEVAYWVSQNNFYFFEELVKILNNTDQTYEFFEKIPESQGFFPILSVERTLLRREKSRIYVVNISDKKVNDSLFSIPNDFELMLH